MFPQPSMSFYSDLIHTLLGQLQTSIAKVVQRKNSWFVMDHTGKKQLGGPYKTKDEAVKRLRQIEYFKHQG